MCCARVKRLIQPFTKQFTGQEGLVVKIVYFSYYELVHYYLAVPLPLVAFNPPTAENSCFRLLFFLYGSFSLSPLSPSSHHLSCMID